MVHLSSQKTRVPTIHILFKKNKNKSMTTIKKNGTLSTESAWRIDIQRRVREFDYKILREYNSNDFMKYKNKFLLQPTQWHYTPWNII